MAKPDRYYPFTENFWCQHQTLYPNMGITVYGGYDQMAVGMMRLPLEQRYMSFTARLSQAICQHSQKGRDK